MNDETMIQVGKRYYFMVHAYHHFIGEVVKITGRKSCILKDVRRIQSCMRGWTEFFKDGAKNDTSCTIFPDGTFIDGWFAALPWNHPIPENAK
jgi:hypothetical protein